jgi:exopolysaccharide biosynthesis polyprenyl glycosylphosphotransferase
MKDRGSKQNLSIQGLQMVDAILVWLGFMAASFFDDPIRELLNIPAVSQRSLVGMTWVVFVVVPLTPLVLERSGFYDNFLNRRRGQSLTILFRSLLVVVFIVGLISVFGKFIDTKRLVLGMGLASGFFLIWARGFLTIRYLRSRAASEGFAERVVLAGNPEETQAFLDDLEPGVLEAWKIVSHFNLETNSVGDLNNLIKVEAVQRVVFLARHTEFERVARAVETCEVQGVEAWIGASFLRTQVARPGFDVIAGQPMLVFRSTPELSWQLFAKKMVDILGALAIIVLSSPLWLAAYLGIRFSSPGAPVFFTQQRAGIYGKPFRIFKFRTMVPNAEKLLDKIKEEHGNEVDGPAFKLASDPRIFPFGHFLRRYSIDELPQMINVLRGEMSLVGPRPLPLHEIEAIKKSSHRRRLSVKPGVTCIWQISGRSDITDFEEWVKLDEAYIDHWSIWEDFRILIKTVPAVLFSKGAR